MSLMSHSQISGGGGGGGGGGGAAVPQRKKSLPDSVTLPRATPGIPREELAALGSARRQELHRMQEEAERYKANPLLYLLNPNVKVSYFLLSLQFDRCHHHCYY